MYYTVYIPYISTVAVVIELAPPPKQAQTVTRVPLLLRSVTVLSRDTVWVGLTKVDVQQPRSKQRYPHGQPAYINAPTHPHWGGVVVHPSRNPTSSPRYSLLQRSTCAPTIQ